MATKSRRLCWQAVLAAVVVPALMASGCSSGKNDAAKPAAPAAPAGDPAVFALSPAAGSGGLPISTEVGLQITQGKLKTVTLTDASGSVVAGHPRADQTSWVPDGPLAANTGYTATAVVTGTDGKDVSQTTSFSTMASPANRADTGLYFFDGQEYGVAMPIVVEFPSGVPDAARPLIQSRLFVSTTPEQPGVWHWTGARQVTYRAQHYWEPGTVISVRAALDGLPFGDGSYGDQDRRGTARIADNKVEMFIDNETKQMTVYENGVASRTMPVSLGKADTPSSSGKMVVMTKAAQTVFDTTNEPGVDHYRADISYAQRLTWGGEFIHAAPWSVGDQGVRNVSHGCVNMSWDNAEWLFNVDHVGDPVTVTGTEVALSQGNGFTAWDLTWDDFIKGSALPVPAALAKTVPNVRANPLILAKQYAD